MTFESHVSYEELFKATGGLRMGMRARASQKGKWTRAENGEMTKSVMCACAEVLVAKGEQ